LSSFEPTALSFVKTAHVVRLNFSMLHESQTASPWMIRFADRVAAGSTLLDVACGYGRHAKFFAARGVQVTAVDRDGDALASLRDVDNVSLELRDLESEGWPYASESFDAVLVCNYLWRPTFNALLSTIKVGGLLLYETFMEGNERYGKPSRAEFLLQSNELLVRTRDDFCVFAYEEGDQRAATGDVTAVKAQIAAVRKC
jgi:SAM-dependent methyltransferase